MLKSNSSLRTLKLIMNNIRCSAELGAAVGANDGLNAINLSDNAGGIDDLQRFYDALAHGNSRLTRLHFTSTIYVAPSYRSLLDQVDKFCARNIVRQPSVAKLQRFVFNHWFVRDVVQTLQWKAVHKNILNICIAMAPLCLPSYVLLWIIDELPNYDRVSHFKKIRLIESIKRSIGQLVVSQF